MLELAIEWSSSTLDASISSNTSVILTGSSRPSVSCSATNQELYIKDMS